jgi:carbonic anhydrase
MHEDRLESILETLQSQPQSTTEAPTDARTVLVVSCSMTQRGTNPSPWPVTPPRAVTTIKTLGNQVLERRDDHAVLPAIERCLEEQALEAVLVMGHTDCTVVADAYDTYVGTAKPRATGIETRLAPLLSLVEAAIESEIVDEAEAPGTIQHRLVEYSVVHQVRSLVDQLPTSVTVVGYVHDRDGVYDTFSGKAHLVTIDGETDEGTLRSRLPENESVSVQRLLD